MMTKRAYFLKRERDTRKQKESDKERDRKSTSSCYLYTLGGGRRWGDERK
jgi:hypothetical protein